MVRLYPLLGSMLPLPHYPELVLHGPVHYKKVQWKLLCNNNNNKNNDDIVSTFVHRTQHCAIMFRGSFHYRADIDC